MKVTLLGDSIRQIGYGKRVPQLLSPEFEVFQPDENCRFIKYTLLGLHVWKEGMAGSRIVHWNNGLWDTCDRFGDGPFTSMEEYLENIMRTARLLQARADTVIFATTTPVLPPHHDQDNSRIAAYNALVVPELQKQGVLINDLFSTVYAHMDEYICEDHCHLSAAGIEACAAQTADIIRTAAAAL